MADNKIYERDMSPKTVDEDVALLSGQLFARWPVCPQVKQRGCPSLVLGRVISTRWLSFLLARPRMLASKCRSRD